MAYWSLRGELSRANRMRRSYFEMLRDELDDYMLQYALTDSYKNFLARKIPYPFVEKRELKPRARIPDIEYDCQNTFLVIFLEDTLPSDHKKYIRFFDANKTTKKNLLRSKTVSLADNFDRNQKHLESAHFFDFLHNLLPVDYALLIQRDPASRARDRYSLSHYHVRVDWPIADAAEDMARNLRYISKHLYEKGDKYAEDVQKKFFEFYGQPYMSGGRRTAAMVAYQYFIRIPCITTVYAGSSESRALIRIAENGVSRAVLMRLTKNEIDQLAGENGLKVATFKKNYMIERRGKGGVFIFEAIYSPTASASPPEDGKLREIKPDLNWLTVSSQLILPKPGVWKYPPLHLNAIYS